MAESRASIDAADAQGLHTLVCAAGSGNLDIVRYLVAECRANINAVGALNLLAPCYFKPPLPGTIALCIVGLTLSHKIYYLPAHTFCSSGPVLPMHPILEQSPIQPEAGVGSMARSH